MSAASEAILLVDDDEEELTETQRVVATAFPHLRVLVAQDAETALMLMEEPIRVIISDYRLGPGMDGAQFLALAARRQPAAKRIAISGKPDGYLLGLGKEFGFEVLTKPIEQDLLVRILRHHLKC